MAVLHHPDDGAGHDRWTELASGPAPVLVTDLPGPLARTALARDRAIVSPSMGRVYPLVPRRGAGCVIEDVDGNRFLDLNAGIAVTATGHSHPSVVAAITSQAGELLHYCSSDWYLPIYAELAERLADGAPVRGGDVRVFLGNSGTEAVEAALKLARIATGRQGVIAFLGGFHGRTAGSLSLTASKAHYRSGFGAHVPGVHHAPYGDADHIDDVIFRHLVDPDDVAAIVVEPIQGEGGYLVPPAGFLARLRDICDRHGIVLIVDEVQSGIGRTGRRWALDHEEVEADVLLAGKGLASGLPLSAVIARADLMAAWGPGKHGSTFGGNPVACAAALATLDLVDGGLATNADEMGSRVRAGLCELQRRHASVVDVRGRGLMIGLELGSAEAAKAVEQRGFRHGLLLLTCGPAAVRIAPPLVIREDRVDTALTVLDTVLDEIEGVE